MNAETFEVIDFAIEDNLNLKTILTNKVKDSMAKINGYTNDIFIRMCIFVAITENDN